MGNSNKYLNDGDIVQWDQSEFHHVLYKDKNLEVTLPLHDPHLYDHWLRHQALNPASTSKFALNPIKNHYDPDGMCGSGGTLRILFEGYPYPLQKIIENRTYLERGHFSEKMLWYLLWGISDVARRFHRAALKVGDIMPRNILLNHSETMKVVHQFSWPENKTNYKRALHEQSIAYVSPEELRQMGIGHNESTSNLSTCESFSTGLTLLDAALLCTCENLYSKNYTFDEEALSGKRTNLENEARYSKELKYVILNLTEIEPADRMSLIELNQWLQPDSDIIETTDSYCPRALPQKVRQTAGRNPIRDRDLDFGRTVFLKNQNRPFEAHYQAGRGFQANQAHQGGEGRGEVRGEGRGEGREGGEGGEVRGRGEGRGFRMNEAPYQEMFKLNEAPPPIFEEEQEDVKCQGLKPSLSQSVVSPAEGSQRNDLITFLLEKEEKESAGRGLPAQKGGEREPQKQEHQHFLSGAQEEEIAAITFTQETPGGPTRSSRSKSASKKVFRSPPKQTIPSSKEWYPLAQHDATLNGAIHHNLAQHDVTLNGAIYHGLDQNFRIRNGGGGLESSANSQVPIRKEEYKRSPKTPSPNYVSNYQVNSNLPASPRPPKSNEAFLQMVEQKIKYSRLKFPSH